jgi:uncharacterized RDD family membrane protein YckC
VLAPGVHACNFCESREPLPREEGSRPGRPSSAKPAKEAWRGELSQRVQAYRARRRKGATQEGQADLPFDDHTPSYPAQVAVQVDEPVALNTARPEHFAFTVAIGRIANNEPDDPRVLIDVSNPPNAESTESEPVLEQTLPPPAESLPVAALDDRRRSLLIDAACLAFAYGSFLALFGSLGGHFTLSKLSAAVCFSTFAFVYIQYFGLFSIFGGSTPGMMLCGLQVASVTSDTPTPRQYLLRAAGYILSAGTCFLGFLWVLWDEEELTWHDRISQTYLTNVEAFREEDASHAAPAR